MNRLRLRWIVYRLASWWLFRLRKYRVGERVTTRVDMIALCLWVWARSLCLGPFGAQLRSAWRAKLPRTRL